MPSYSLPQDIYDAVVRDGQPREADDLSGSGTRHMLYREQGIVRSCLLADWPVVDAALTEAAALRGRQAAQRAHLMQQAQSAVGQNVEQLSASQYRALQILMLWRTGAVDDAGLVRPIGQWLDP